MLSETDSRAQEEEDPELGESRVPIVPSKVPAEPGSYCSSAADPVATAQRDSSGFVLPWVDSPRAVAAIWSVHGALIYGDKRIEWQSDLAGPGPWEIVVPPEGYFDGNQRDWVSLVQLELAGADEAGRPVASSAVESLWVVWPDGVTPVWLDRLARELEAPTGAWSPAAQAAVVASLDGLPADARVEPPMGGAK